MKLFNTLSGRLEEFKPLSGREVRMYACGPTVYDFAHIGNFRTFVFEDLLRRFLDYKGFKVKHVMNVTDVDDKTIAGAARDGKKLEDFTKQYLNAFNKDLNTLNILAPAKQPKATAEIPSMIKLIEQLIEKKLAYVSDGSVYYRVDSFKDYGKLSKKDLKQNIKGVRVDSDEYEKEEGSDFALWKKAKEEGPSWDSPWGKGRPGWHVECSAMSMKCLGETIDIHAGGEDLIFPHHENEIAQSEGVTGKPFVKYWLHAKHLLVNGEKMSKSKGNFYTLRDLLAKGYDPMAIRYVLLSVHYRKPLNFTLDALKEAQDAIKKFDDCYWMCLNYFTSPTEIKRDLSGDKNYLDHLFEELNKWMSDDLNVSGVLATVNEAVSEFNRDAPKMDTDNLKLCLHFFEIIDQLLGLNIAQFKSIPVDIDKKRKQLIDFRKQKNFDKADAVRADFQSHDWFVKDGKPGEPSILKKKNRVWDK